jgi:RsiW-degrading membrane proteinase PrsW (M82 family)
MVVALLLILFFGLVVVLPTTLWLLFIRREDRSEPEPGRLMRICVYGGITAGLAAGVFELLFFTVLGLPQDTLTLGAVTTPLYITAITVFLVGLIEELAKYLVLRANVYFNHEFNQIFDGIVYGITIAIAFSFVENLLYFVDILTNNSIGVFIMATIFRGLFTTLGHVTFTGVMGYYIGKAKFSVKNKNLLIVQGVVFASLLHGLYDFILASHMPFGFLIGIVYIIAAFFIFMRVWKHPEVRMVWKYVPATPPPALPPTTA